ncbi:MAG: alpha/beta fold hydrolase, partial [Smithellaceae bacterium]|nr:alpha/beta fold hydrolase [Smithellaceae bacterium]
IIQIKAEPLRLTLKTTIRHAAATRNEGESIWVRAQRREHTGYGEGCPRDYVAGDDLASSLKWIEENFSEGKADFSNLDDVRQWISSHEKIIDQYPSAWCAVEMAVLDLLAREKGCSVEALLGVTEGMRFGRYTAVLGDSKSWQYATLVDQYLIRGITDFKIKLGGNLEKDKQKIDFLEVLSVHHHVPALRIRLDANNLWKKHCDEAIAFTRALGCGRLFAVEEPVQARDVKEISRFSTATGLPVILDESLCTLEHLRAFQNVPGQFIANIKISRVGGLIRALRMITEVKKRGWPIIIGCHVGETSLLTRAALVASAAADESLAAHEGAFGDYLVQREPVYPTLKFGREGNLDLRLPYYLKTVLGLQIVPVENWNTGFGMQCRMPQTPDDGAPEICFLEMPDQYKIHFRRWGPPEGEDAVLILHGGMSHSGWQAPLAIQLRSMMPELTVIAADRRGCGLNDKRGDLGSVHAVIEDVIQHVEFLKKSFKRVHLMGWSQGALFAAVAASKMHDAVSSLVLMTPVIFSNERFRSVVSITGKIVSGMIAEFKLKPDYDHACIPVPMEATDFTLVDEWLDFIEKDDLKTIFLNLKSTRIMEEIQEMSRSAMLKNRLPVLVIMAEQDRIVDNNKVKQLLDPLFFDNKGNQLITLSSGHAIQFEKPEEAALAILNFIRNLNSRISSRSLTHESARAYNCRTG